MSELLKKKELENFQVASTTLDASAKIYAGRVDAIYSETYKVLTGLGRSDKNKHEGDEQEAVDGEVPEGQEENEEIKKKKRAKKSNTIETNLKNIRQNKMDLEFEVDPLFKVMTASFDEGGTAGLLLNNLRCFDDSQELVLDSSTILPAGDDFSLSQSQDSKVKPTDLSDIKEMYRGKDIGSLEICPAFSNFVFTEWDGNTETSVLPSQGATDHEFDMNAEAEPIPDMDDNASDLPPDMADFPMDDDDDNGGSDTSHNEGEGQITEDRVKIGDGRAAQLMQNAIRDLTHGTSGTLLSVLASEPSDYSYFNKAILRTWAGPSHWRLGPLSKDPRFKNLTEDKSKRKKIVFKLEYEDDKDFDKFFKKSKGTTLTKLTLTKYSKDKNTLPKDLHFDADKLFRLFTKTKIMIKRQNATTDNIDDNIDNYDYDNRNDRENFCPQDMEGDDNDDDTGGNFDFNFTDDGSVFSQSQDSECSQRMTFDQTQLDGTLLTGDRLIAQPHKVAKIDIEYARTAKKMDVKKLKSTIWNILTHDEEKDKMNSVTTPNPALKIIKEMDGTCTFQSLLNELPKKVSNNMANNLSVPIAFVCLLHLANEKTLKILDNNMEDLMISQGI
ncbi:hypothetical protein KUTeg_005127 [Tegillarca granosa]|uniref:Condensin complex subunit 2 n=1 Tax=Tegillarca granosa TaxID=220873 RepID=A0ABQ9FIU1_TEGGR|nr:hypothetical protein KUTeg_005127 [Tegillarca granosa]